MGQDVLVTLSIGEILTVLAGIGGAVFTILKLLIAAKLEEIAKAQTNLASEVYKLQKILGVLEDAYHKVDKEIAVQIAKWERNS